jgi:hypothetical protein
MPRRTQGSVFKNYLGTIPNADEIPASQVVIHNSVRPTRRLGDRGFRAWLAAPDDPVEPCNCGWAPELGLHCRVTREGTDATPDTGQRLQDPGRLRHPLARGRSAAQRTGFKTKTEARRWFADNVAARLDRGAPSSDITLAELVELYLERQAAAVRSRTIATLRDRLRHAVAAFGDVPLRELEGMSDEIAGWQAGLPPRAGHGIAQALRQVLDAAVRWRRLAENPAKLAGRNPKPPPRPVRAFAPDELDAIAAELSPIYRPLPGFTAATGLRPEEWQALERRDLDRPGGVLNVRRTVSTREVVELAKTARSRRQVPLTRGCEHALDALPPRLDTNLLFPAKGGGLLNLDNFRRREWTPAVESERGSPGRQDLRPPIDVRLRRARRGRVRFRAGAGDGQVDRDDRTPLRDAARRGGCGLRQPPRRARRGA